MAGWPDGRARLGNAPASAGAVGGPKLGTLGAALRSAGRAALVASIALAEAGVGAPRESSRRAGMIVRGATEVAESGCSVATLLGR
jgi:hypothetical protein